MPTAASPPSPPSFDIDSLAVTKQAEELIATSRRIWDQVGQTATADATFSNSVLLLLHDENERLSRTNVIGHFERVSASKELRDASQKANELLSQDRIGRWSREDVFRVVDAVWNKNEQIDPEWRLFLEEAREQFLRAGLGLQDEASKLRLKEIQLRLQQAKDEYRRNLDSDIGGLWLTVEELEGVPASHLERWKADGDMRWVKHKAVNQLSVMTHAIRANVRKKMWVSWENRVKESNGPLLKEMAVLRDEEARLLGYKNHADARESDRIMKTQDAMEFLSRMRRVLQELGGRELQSLKELKREHTALQKGNIDPASSPEHFFVWDRGYYLHLEKLRSFQIDGEKIAEYFPFEGTLERMLLVLGTMFGVKFVKQTTSKGGNSTWHPDVLLYALWDDDGTEAGTGEFLGHLYLDVFPRDFKYGHKGHFRIQPGYTREDGTRAYPCSAFITNYSPPATENIPSLLKYGEVVSTFHELGHSIHNLTSKTRCARFHGTAVPRDFVEIPSIMLEHVFWNREVLRMISGRYGTADRAEGEEKLPYELADQLIASRFATVGVTNLSTLLISTFDLKIHGAANHEAIRDMNMALEFNKLQNEITLVDGVEALGEGWESTHGFCRWRFPMGYDTVYYTYLLARAFSYDIFETKFKPLLPTETARTMDQVVSPELRDEFRRYRRVVLQPGGSVRSYIGLLEEYLGREPSEEAYTRMLRGRWPQGQLQPQEHL